MRPMLNVILMLVLGSGTPDVLQLDRDELTGRDLPEEVTSRDDVQAVRARLLLANVEDLRTLGDELGRRMVGVGPDDFEERLADMFDDDRFAAFLGGVMRLTRDVIDEPRLVQAIEATLEPPRNPEPGTIGARFMDDCEPLEAAFGADTALVWLKSHRSRLETAPFFRMDATMIGRQLLDAVYNPAATPKLAAVSRSVVRFFARMLVVRHATIANARLPVAYITGLFEHSTEDIDNVGSVLVSLIGEGSEGASHRFSSIDLQLEFVNQDLNQLYIRRAIQHSPRSSRSSDDEDLA